MEPLKCEYVKPQAAQVFVEVCNRNKTYYEQMDYNQKRFSANYKYFHLVSLASLYTKFQRDFSRITSSYPIVL